jgi:hypothetical protein
MEKLWTGGVPSRTTVDGTSVYTRDGLIGTLVAMMQSFGPDVIRAQDFVGTFGDGDHSDHHAGALFAKEAGARWAPRHSLVGYVGNGITNMPANVFGPAVTAKSQTFLAYAQFDSTICHTVDTCVNSPFYGWWSRQYVAGSFDQGTAPPLWAPTPPKPAVVTPLKGAALKKWCRTHPRALRCKKLQAPRTARKP